MYQLDQEQIGAFLTDRITDILPDGTVCTVLKPENWNGTLLLDLDGATNCNPKGPFRERGIARLITLFEGGYAYGGIQRNAVGYRFPDAVQYLVNLRDAFTEHFGEPEYTVAYGGSRGAFVGRMCMEYRPDIFDGALVFGGGGSGEIAAINSKLDGKFVLNALLEPEEPITLAGIQDLQAEEEKTRKIIEEAAKTPLGRARLALSAAYEQLPAWADPSKPEPGKEDYEEQFAQLMTCIGFAQFNLGTYMIEQLAGGPFSWNTETDYEDLLERSGRKAFVEYLYEQAGGADLLKNDLLLLRLTPRIAADPKAVAKAEKFLSYSGKIEGPVVNLENIGDQVDPESCKYAYRDTLKKRGKEDLLRVLWVHSSGHCNFSDAEVSEALAVLMNRVRSGSWGDLSPENLNREAAALNRGESRFFDYTPAEALHSWDFEQWDTYGTLPERFIPFEKICNVRDLGGLLTRDGRRIRKGKLLRAGGLNGASPADIEKLAGLVSLVADFRSVGETKERPDPEIPGARYWFLPAMQERAEGVERDRESDENSFRRSMEDPTVGMQFMIRFYEYIAVSEYMLGQQKKLLGTLLEPRDKAVLWHCSAGKDRTGTFAIILEEILGVPKEDIVKDYLLTNVGNREMVEQLIRVFASRPGMDPVKAVRPLHAMFDAQIENIQAYYRGIEREFGNVDNFLREGLGIDDETRERFKEMYLEENE